jgi:hypothetical protein
MHRRLTGIIGAPSHHDHADGARTEKSVGWDDYNGDLRFKK